MNNISGALYRVNGKNNETCYAIFN